MRSIFLLAVFSLAMYNGDAQTLFTFGNHRVSKDEFLRAYNKNRVDSENDSRVLKDYLDLYINFKLKVQAARDLHLDTLQQIKTDVASFRKQVQENYMNDETATNTLFKEALLRSANDVHVLYFSVPLQDAPGAEEAIRFIHNALKSGRTDYEAIAREASTGSTAQFRDIGFINIFTVPENFEKIIYALKPGEVSEPYKTQSAWHIFKSAGQRPNPGKWKLSQILFALPEDATPAQVAAAKHKADSVHALLKAGRNFADAAREFSDDKLSYAVGGELPEFTSGKYDVVFESHAFALKNDGDISQPFSTPYGIHILKRTSHTPYPGVKDGNLQYEIRQRLLKDARIQVSRDKFNKDIRVKTGFKETRAVSENDLLRFADTVMRNLSVEKFDSYPISGKTIIRFKKSSQKGADWLRFVRDYKANYELDKGEKGKELWDKYIDVATQEYYKDHLEEYNEAFAFQMKEFMEGNMLFEVMERNVWGKASTDSAGLADHYAKHKEDYKWGESMDAVIFHSPTEEIAKPARTKLMENMNWNTVADLYPDMHTDSGRFEISQFADDELTSRSREKTISEIKVNNDGSAVFMQFIKYYPAGEIKSFDQARGLVINDYQHVLEDKWLAQLKKKYPVKLNQAVANTLYK